MPRDHQRLLGAAGVGIVIATIVVVLKYLAFRITGSVALFSDAVRAS
jgi:divalent metal cation (Fe/Co/Zn/Cd) transporter